MRKRIYCKKCNKGTEHDKIKGLNAAQKAVGYSILLFSGLPCILDDEKFECIECGTKRG